VWVGHSHDKDTLTFVERDKPKLAHRLDRDRGKPFEIDAISIERFEGHPVLLSERLGPGRLGQRCSRTRTARNCRSDPRVLA
jgi:hypothetical protein